MNYNEAAAQQYNPNKPVGGLQGKALAAPERIIPSLLSSIEKELSQLDNFQRQVFDASHRIIDPVPTTGAGEEIEKDAYQISSIEGRLRNILQRVREANMKADRNITIINSAV